MTSGPAGGPVAGAVDFYSGVSGQLLTELMGTPFTRFGYRVTIVLREIIGQVQAAVGGGAALAFGVNRLPSYRSMRVQRC